MNEKSWLIKMGKTPFIVQGNAAAWQLVVDLMDIQGGVPTIEEYKGFGRFIS